LGLRSNFLSLVRAHSSLGDTYIFLLRKIENEIVGKLRTPKGKVHWGRKIVPKKRQCHTQIFIPQGGVIVDCFWEFEVIFA